MAFTLHAGVQAFGSLIFLLIRMIRREGLSGPGDRDDCYRGALGRTVGLLIPLLVAIPVSFTTRWANALSAVVPFVLGRIRRRRG